MLQKLHYAFINPQAAGTIFFEILVIGIANELSHHPVDSVL